MWDRRTDRPWIIAHRGASQDFCENTIDAFVGAREAGADGIELDVHVCRSGQLVVFHDFDLMRLANREGRISELSLDELRRVELPGGARIPTLADVFEELPKGFLINVEIKSRRVGAARTVVASLARLIEKAPRDGVWVSSFDPTALWELRRLAPGVPRGLLFHSKQVLPLRRGWLHRVVGASAVHPEAALIAASMCDAWHRKGLRVSTWTVDEPVEMRRLAGAGIDALITNDPAGAVQVFVTKTKGEGDKS